MATQKIENGAGCRVGEFSKVKLIVGKAWSMRVRHDSKAKMEKYTLHPLDWNSVRQPVQIDLSGASTK
ncbi:unnamed protein product [Dovyalis caffra]|uniref:Uncharacterized protein n=1 Tax=Dovyalis caffra TaxID=77055 RepID=A0AAV1R8M5_9ROSI|nr:unnamed protein product [Dovyalis caffra]